MTVNKVILVGNLGADPELRTSQGGSPIASLRLATSERRKDKEGNWSDHTEWHRVVVFGRTADNVGKFCKKGKQIYVEGRLSTREWQDKEGNRRWTTEVVADDVRFLGGAGERSGGGGYGGGGGGSSYDDASYGESTGGGHGGGHGDDDIPF
jgi:single-strand DNA-binding protein